ncbi:MAG: hypothetical protein ACI8X3_002133 [Saprospiraceae bacterium]|jgi:hypothetical protein
MLAAMMMQYDYVRPGARNNNLLEWNNGQLHDVSGRSRSPYLQDTCFAITVLQQKVTGLKFEYILPADLVFTNLNWNIERIQIDFDDGLGFRSSLVDKAIEVNYITSGEKTIRLQYHYNGKRFNMATFLKVEFPVFIGNRDSSPYDKENPEEIPFGGMDISIFSACEDGKVRRPMIVLEGFAGEKFNSGDMFTLLNNAATSNNGSLHNFLNTNEYDLIYVDYKNSLLPIETNADYLIEVIEWINTRKHADGSSEPNILIGNSMGGLVGKVALLKMHNELEKDAEVERFFSYDAPMKGANYPIGVQAFLRDLVTNQSNIFLFSQAQVNNNNNNNIGIHIEKGGTLNGGADFYGMVLMDCAELFNNTVGVLGVDITLQIDTFINAGTEDVLLIRPNKFHGIIVEGGSYFDICYVDLLPYIGDKIPATGNYWGGATNSSEVFNSIHVKKDAPPKVVLPAGISLIWD